LLLSKRGTPELIRYIHIVLDRALRLIKLVQNREVGWRTVDRKTGRYEREQQPIYKKLKLLLLFNPLTDWLDRTHLMRLWVYDKTIRAGKKEATGTSAYKIRSFVDFYHINMDDFYPSDISAYLNFEDFFVRQHTPESRPIFGKNDDSKAVIVADSRVVVYPTVSQAKALWIKGKHFTMEQLVLKSKRSQTWADGAVASFRLSPQDYHRFHSPVTGKVSWFKQISGDYYQVDPLCLSSNVDILTRNTRCCLEIESSEFGKVLFVAIGATDVGTVRIKERLCKADAEIKKGDEIGLFQFGGSSIIVAFEKDRISFDEDILHLSRQRIMMNVEVGMSMGTANPSPAPSC